jgi:hypothetical protein
MCDPCPDQSMVGNCNQGTVVLYYPMFIVKLTYQDSHLQINILPYPVNDNNQIVEQ